MGIQDNYSLFLQKEAEERAWLESLPKCDFCGEPIQQEKAICYDGCWACAECELDFWRSIRDDFLERVESNE